MPLNQATPVEEEILPSGSRQSKELRGYIYLPFEPLKLVAAVRHYGVLKYGENNHLGIPVNDHLDHAIAHIYKYKEGFPSEHSLVSHDSVEHLAHAICRLIFAMQVDIEGADPTLDPFAE
jgi:hypothetical protein